MWEYFCGRGNAVFPVEELRGMSFDELIRSPSDQRENNIRIADENNPLANSLNTWTPLLRDAVSGNNA